MTWCDKSVLKDDCGEPNCFECAKHRRNFNQAVLGLHEEPTRVTPENFKTFFGETAPPSQLPDPRHEAMVNLIHRLGRISNRLWEAEEIVRYYATTSDWKENDPMESTTFCPCPKILLEGGKKARAYMEKWKKS